MSASKMRAAAKAGDLVKFKSGLPSRLKSAAKLVMDKLKQYLSEDLDEAVLTLSQRLKRRTQMRRVKGKIRLGQRRALARKATSKVISRRSKRVAIKMMRKRILRGRKYQDLSYSSRAAVDRQVARRKTAVARLAKRIEPKLRQAEGRRRSGQGFKSISLSPTPIKKKKLREGMSRDNLIQSVNTIMKRIIAEQNYSLAPLEQASLIRKSNETGVPVKVIKEVYARGVASWNMGLREDTTPQQWGFARVNSFLAGGFNAYTADRDLLEQDLAKDAVKKQDEKKSLEIIKTSEDSYSLRSYKGHGSTDKVKAAADARLKELGIDDDAPAQPAAAGGEQPQGVGQAVATADLNAPAQFSASTANAKAAVIQNNSPNNQQLQPVDDQQLQSDGQSAKPDNASKEESFAKAKQIVDRTIELIKKRQSIKPKNEKTKQEAKEIDEELEKNAVEYRAMGISGELTNEDFAKSREKYDRKTAPKALPEHTETWNKSLEIDNEAIANLRSSDPENPPGTASSAQNEIISGIAATQIIKNDLDLSSKNHRSRLAVYAAKLVLDEKGNVVSGSYMHQIRIRDKSKKLSLPDGVNRADINNFRKMIINGPTIRDGVNNEEIVSKLDDKQILAMYTIANMAHAKATVIRNATKTLGWEKDKLSSVSYTGSKSQIQTVSNDLKRMKQEQIDVGIKKPYVVNQFGEKLDMDTAIRLAETTGGGENSSDTTILTRNSATGEILFTQTSDKSNPKDQLGNTTVSAQFDDYALTIKAKMKAGQISEEQMNNALAVLDETRKKVKLSENMLANERYAYSSNLIDLIKNKKGGGSELVNMLADLSSTDTKYLDAFLKHPEAKGKGDIEKIQNVLEYMNKAVSTGDENALKTFNATHQEAMKRLSDEKRWYGSKVKPEMPSLEESNRHVKEIVNSHSSLSNTLDDLVPNLGRDCSAYELMHRGHLTQHLNGALGSYGDPATHGCFSLILGDYSPTTEMYQKGMGVDNVKDFLDGFNTTPVELTETKGRATGGSKLFVAEKHTVNDKEIATTNYDDDKENPGLLKALAGIYKQYTRTRGGPSWSVSMTHSDDILKIFRNIVGPPPFSTKFQGTLKETFYNFLSYINESNKIMSVGKQPTVNPKPLHHKASGHKYHLHHMMDPNVGLKHQVKDSSKRIDKDVDGDIDQFDKPSSKLPDEVPVPTKKSTAQFFAKYKKEREHIHAGEPIDEKKIVFSEGPLSPIPKTDKPNLFHGNYGGKGNRGGKPVDKLDQAFQKHDTGYHYTPDPEKRLKHDKSLVKATSSIVKDKSQPIKTRVKAGMATALFKTKLALKKKKKVDEQKETSKYTGDENSWYLDAYGQKVRVFSQADLKYPENVDGFLKKPFQQKDIGTIMSMDDFLKTQPEKKK
jgi:hypothetical protein